MMKTELTMEQFEEMQPCEKGLEFARACQGDFARMWEKCERGDWMIWGLRRLNKLDQVTAVRLSIACGRHVLPIFEKKYPDDKRPRLALDAAEVWLNDPSEENRVAARSAANEAWSARDAAYAAAYAADAAASAADAAYAAADAAYAAERKRQADKIRELVANPFAGREVES